MPHRTTCPCAGTVSFTFAIQDPELESLLARIATAGGKRRMAVRKYFSGDKPYRMVYVEDPCALFSSYTTIAMNSPTLPVDRPDLSP